MSTNTSPASTTPSDRQLDIEFEVPDDLLSLGAELDDGDAAATHAEFVDSQLADGAPPELREQALAQLDTARRQLIEGQVRYLGVAAAELEGRWVMCLFGVSIVAFSPPPESFHAGDLLAGVLGHQYGPDETVVEGFETDYGPAVGVQRAEAMTVPNSDPPQQIDTGVAQALVLFPHLAVLGVVSGYCLDLDDIDLTAAIVGTIAHTLNITDDSDPQH